MNKVENKKAIRKLAGNSFRANRSRNIVAAIAIALTALLFTSLFTMGFGMVESMQRATMRISGGSGHASVKYLTEEQFKVIKEHPLVKEMAYTKMLADSVDNENLIRRHTEFWYFDDIGIRMNFTEPTDGRVPIKENEILADTKTLELLGVPLEVGAPVHLEITVHGKEISRDFVLAGWYSSDPAMNVGLIFSSKAYVDTHKDELYNSYRDDYCVSGAINGYIMFDNSLDIDGNLETVVTESGFSMDEDADNFLETGINWAYMSAGVEMDISMVIAIAAGLLLIMLTGYLIIYNIFQISVVRDIRFYGLLKTIGTTGSQIKTIIRRQALILSLIGIPFGLLGGFFSGKALVPLLMELAVYAGNQTVVSPNPLIFIGAAIFALITVFISTNKPGNLASKVSPVEAVRSSDSEGDSTKRKSSRKGTTPHRMALSNLGRNKKRTTFVILSLSLCIVLTNTVFTLSQSVDVNKALEKFSDSDFLLGPGALFSYRYDPSEEGMLSESFIAAVESQDGFETGGRLYNYRAFYRSDVTRQTNYQQADGTFFTNIYGLEDFPYSRLELVDGEMDINLLKSGDYILEAAFKDDYGNIVESTINHNVGDKVTLVGLENGREREFTILGHVIANPRTNTDGSWGGAVFFLPVEIFKECTGVTWPMSYMFDMAAESEEDMQRFLEQYTGAVEPTMSFRSKFTAFAGISGVRNVAVIVGGGLAAVVGVIGILNFINAVLTGIITRRKEFAMLQSIGMTRRQLVQMLCGEGVYYALFTAVTAVVLGVVLSLIIVRPLCGVMWFTSYEFVFMPMIAAIPALIISGIVIPLVSYRMTYKHSIVERLREAE